MLPNLMNSPTTPDNIKKLSGNLVIIGASEIGDIVRDYFVALGYSCLNRDRAMLGIVWLPTHERGFAALLPA